MACDGAYASANDFNQYWCLSLNMEDPGTLEMLNRSLALAAADIHVMLAAVGGCNCATNPGWAYDYLKKLNVIDAAVVYACPCMKHLSIEEKRMWLEWIDRQAALIRESKIDLCGQTGSDAPAWGQVELNLTPWNAARIIQNRIQRIP